MGDSWIGLKKLEPYSQNNFEWSDGTPYDFTAWKDGEPNNGGPDCKFLKLKKGSYFSFSELTRLELENK